MARHSTDTPTSAVHALGPLRRGQVAELRAPEVQVRDQGQEGVHPSGSPRDTHDD